MTYNENEVKEVILNLLFSYSTTRNTKPSAFEIMSVEMALPYIKDEMDETTYKSYLDWIETYKELNVI